MSERSLNLLIKFSMLITIGSFFSFTLGFINDATAIKYIKYVFMVGFCVTPLLLILKIISRLFLSGVKGQSVLFIESIYSAYYFLLTKEARKEWADYISEQKEKAVK